MSIKSHIADGNGTDKLAHLHDKERNVGQIVYTDPLIEFSPTTQRFLNPTNGNEMAIQGGFAGTPEIVNNGGDTVAWTGSNIVGNDVNFTSTARPRTGTASVYIDSPNLNDVWQFDKGSIIDLSNYVAVTMWINVDRRWGNGDDISFFGYNTSTGLQVGNSVLLEDYITVSDTDTWQEAIIILSDMGLESSTIDSFRMSLTSQANTAPEFFIDDFQIEETTTSEEYTVLPQDGTILYIDELRFNFVDSFDASLLNNSMFNLSYDKILNEPALLAGINLKRVEDGNIRFSISYNTLGDMLSRGFDITTAISDGTNTNIVLVRKFTDFIILDSRDGDSLSITINDDLSGLISFSALALGKSREVNAV